MSAGEVAVRIGRALWTSHHKPLRYDTEAITGLGCADPDPAVEPHDWLEIPEIGNQFLEICVRCQAERINYQRQFAHERHLRGL